MKANEFDDLFDEAEADILPYLDLAKAKRSGQEQKRIEIKFPIWMIKSLDREAKKLGVSRQALIKVWIANQLQMAHH